MNQEYCTVLQYKSRVPKVRNLLKGRKIFLWHMLIISLCLSLLLSIKSFLRTALGLVALAFDFNTESIIYVRCLNIFLSAARLKRVPCNGTKKGICRVYLNIFQTSSELNRVDKSREGGRVLENTDTLYVCVFSECLLCF